MNNIKDFSEQLQELIKKAEEKSDAELRAERMVIAAKFAMMLRVPYVFGGTYEKNQAWDCSAFVQSLYRFIGSTLPRTTRQQIKKGKSVKLEDAKIGDLIFYDTNRDGTVNHVAMYIGNREMIHTNSPSEGINIQNVDTGKHAKWMIDVRRILPW